VPSARLEFDRVAGRDFNPFAQKAHPHHFVGQGRCMNFKPRGERPGYADQPKTGAGLSAAAASFAKTTVQLRGEYRMFTTNAYLIILLQSSGISVPSHFPQKVSIDMRAEAEALVQSIQQSMGLLRRHL
jgi:hypothetical protein